MKKKLQIILITLLILAPAVRISAQKYFEVLDATSTPWLGDMTQNGTGINYNIKVVLLSDHTITFNDIWIGESYGLLETHPVSYAEGKEPRNGDTLSLTYTVHHYPANSPMAQMVNPVKAPEVMTYKGDALIGFSVGKLKKYRIIKKIRELPAQSYP